MKNLIPLFVVLVLPCAATAGHFDDAAASLTQYTKGRYAPKMDCSRLVSQTTTDYSVVSARKVGNACRVAGIIPGEIRFEVSLPDDWNGRTMMTGNGGLAGQPPESEGAIAARDQLLALNFVSVYSDNGHDNRVEPGARFAYRNLAKLADYGYRAVHLTQVMAEKLVRLYYGRPHRYSYFMGCSNGGRQALMAAQRFPEDFDGILAGAPANDFTGLKFSQAHRMKAIQSSDMTVEKVNTIGRVLLDQCDELDGLKDGLLDDPRRCEFDPASLPRCDDPRASDCFTDRDIDALVAFYAPVKVAGQTVYPAFPVGSEIAGPQRRIGVAPGWVPWVINPYGTPILAALGSEFFRYIVFVEDQPELEWTSVNFDTEPDNLAYTRDLLDAVDPDLTPFRDAGGKLLSAFGWADPDINPISTIDYFESVRETVGETDSFYRLYMVPGMFHCAGGPGPDNFDAVTPLIDWVERNRPPGPITAQHGDEATGYTRPLCPYPARAVYDGTGDPRAATSFSCQRPSESPAR